MAQCHLGPTTFPVENILSCLGDSMLQKGATLPLTEATESCDILCLPQVVVEMTSGFFSELMQICLGKRFLGHLPYLIEKLGVLVPPQDVPVPIPNVAKEVLNNSLWCSQRTSRAQ